MQDEEKTRTQLIQELVELRRQNDALKASEEDLKLAEEAFWESEDRFRIIVDNAYDGIHISELELDAGAREVRRLVYCNDRFVEQAGRSRRALRESPNLNDLLISRLTPEEEQTNHEQLGRLEPCRGVSSWKRPDKKENYHEWVIVPVRLGGKIYCVGILRDVTERRQSEQERVRMERLSALGQISAGISHNLNNILTGVLGPAQIIQIYTRDPKIHRHLDVIMKSAERAAELVQRLHLSAREKEENTIEAVHINQVIGEAIAAARPRWRDEALSRGVTIEISTDLANVPPIRGTTSRFHNILLNLIFNATDAMPQDGQITLSTSVLEGAVQLRFSDTGTGMDEEVRKHIFEPFFTTKANLGTGLGLATVYGTITRWGGEIDVQSEPGKGTTFVLTLPVWEGQDDQPQPEGEVRQTRSADILIADDDEIVLKFLSGLLSPEHQLQLARNGLEALEKLTSHTFDLALLDLGMPGLSGDQVAARIRKHDPRIATVLITGWELEQDDDRLSDFDFVLQKPLYDLPKIRKTLADALSLYDQRAGITGS